MNNINDLTQEQIQEILELRRRLKEQDLKNDSIRDQSLPTEILDDLEYSPKNTFKAKLKKFANKTNNAMENNGPSQERLTRSTSLNSRNIKWTLFRRLRPLPREQIDYGQQVELQRTYIKNSTTLLETVDQKKKCKELDKDGKDLATKALPLPESLKYLEDEDEDEDGKDYFFSPDIVEKIQQTRLQ
ncbi:hypothetical protein G6F43_006584 [Rhizopus delemar]|nr:hypothetical protein G6F43_006584 [Rhizopus delemar]